MSWRQLSMRIGQFHHAPLLMADGEKVPSKVQARITHYDLLK